LDTHQLPTVPLSEDAEAPFRYFPLPHTDDEALKDRKIAAALKQHGYQADPRGSGLVLNEESGERLMMFGGDEATATRADAHWDILRAMDARSKKVRQVRIFPYEAADADEHGLVVHSGHPAFRCWYDLRNGLYDTWAVPGSAPVATAELGVEALFFIGPIVRAGQAVLRFILSLFN
jgi:hypothetical protein